MIDDKELDLLNKQEFGYKRIEIDVSVEGRQEMVKCWTYVQKEHESDPRFNPDRSRKEPSLIYKMVILKGANEHQLPNDYIESIKAYPDNGIVDIDRNDGIPSICESELFSDNNNNNNVEWRLLFQSKAFNRQLLFTTQREGYIISLTPPPPPP